MPENKDWQSKEMPEENQNKSAQKVVEKYYIEVSQSGFKRFLWGFLGGLGWGVGITLGTSLLLVAIGFFVSKIDFVPIIGQFSADIIKAAQSNLKAR